MPDNVLLRMAKESPARRDLLIGFEQLNRESEARAAKADPAKHKLTRVFDAGVSTSYRYWDAGIDGRGRAVIFCWACHRNAAGYFLGWREVSSKQQTKRDMWVARKTKAACQEVARRRQNAWIERAERATCAH